MVMYATSHWKLAFWGFLKTLGLETCETFLTTEATRIGQPELLIQKIEKILIDNNTLREKESLYI